MKQSKIIEAGVRAALKLAEVKEWRALTLAEIAEAADLSLSDFHGVADRDAVSAGVEAVFDAAMNEGSFSQDETERTRLFDVIMMRFEAMEDVRDGALSYLRWRDHSLGGLALRLRARAATARWALACAGLDAPSRLPRAVQVAGLGWAIAQAERAWRQETSPDMTRTMAALDAELIKAEERAGWLKARRHSRSKTAPDPQ